MVGFKNIEFVYIGMFLGGEVEGIFIYEREYFIGFGIDYFCYELRRALGVICLLFVVVKIVFVLVIGVIGREVKVLFIFRKCWLVIVDVFFYK